MEARERRGRLTAVAPTEAGWLYVSGPLTPYDVEALCDHFATLRGSERGDVHVDVDLAGSTRNSPELRQLTSRMRRLKRQGVVVRVHAARAQPTRAATRAKLTPPA